MDTENFLFRVLVDVAICVSGLNCIAMGIMAFSSNSLVAILLIMLGAGGSLTSITLTTETKNYYRSHFKIAPP